MMGYEIPKLGPEAQKINAVSMAVQGGFSIRNDEVQNLRLEIKALKDEQKYNYRTCTENTRLEKDLDLANVKIRILETKLAKAAKKAKRK